MKCSLDFSNFLKRCPVFSIPLFASISLQCSFKKSFSSLLALLNSAFRVLLNSYSVEYVFLFLLRLLLYFFSQLFVRPPQTTTLSSCISFSLGWFWPLPPVQRHELPSIVLQILRNALNHIKDMKVILGSFLECFLQLTK